MREKIENTLKAILKHVGQCGSCYCTDDADGQSCDSHATGFLTFLIRQDILLVRSHFALLIH